MSTRPSAYQSRCRRLENHGAVDFKQGLSVLIAFFHVAIFHSTDALLGCRERGGKVGVEHQPVSTAFSRAIRRRLAAGGLARKLERKGRLPMGCPRSAVAAVT